MATPDNWEQFNEDMRQWQQQAQDLARTYRGLVDVAASGELGALAFIESLSEAPIGDRAALQQTLQVQNVAGRETVGGGARIMREGAFGLGGQGATPPNDDLLLDADSGIYRLTSSNAGVDSASGDILIRGKFGSNNNNRLLLLGTGPINSPVLRLRVQSAFGGWGDTATFFHNQNILGTVSQTDGVPTGAIIERGENANGEYVKFAGGLLICTTQILIDDWETPFFSTRAYPATFSGFPVSGGGGVQDAGPIGYSNSRSAQAVGRSSSWAYDVDGTGTNGNAEQNTLALTAIGYWY